MKKLFSFRRFRDVSISKKLYFTVGIMALLIGIELFVLFFSLNTLSSVRAYVGGEGLWSKSQKDALFHLYRYGITHNEKDYALFNEHMKVPLGDGKARIEMNKEKPDLEKARQGFLEGKNHPDDIDGMIKLFARFSNVSYIRDAIIIWGKAEEMLMELIPIGQALHNAINSPAPSQEKINALLQRTDPLVEKITELENAFSYTLGAGSRWLEALVQKLLFIIALTVEITGLAITILVSRNIQKGLNEIISTSRSFATGNHQARARVFSGDEIGVLATSFNHMSDELQHRFEDLQQAKQKFRQLLESAPDAMIITRPKGEAVLVNAEAQKLFGYNKSELENNSIEDLFIHKKEQGPSNWQNLLHTSPEQPQRLDLYGKHKNGREFPIEVSTSPIETEEGQLISVAIRDISDRQYIKELERKNSELEQFAYIASHDLQEPLGTIASFIMLMEMEKHEMKKETAEYLGYIKQSSERLKALITGLLEYSRIGQKSQLSAVDCNGVMHEVMADMKATIDESGADIKVETLPTLTAYPFEIRLLFQNLLSNAIKYRKPNTKPVISITAKNREQHWEFCVEDNGIGINEKYRDKVFIIFQRLHNNSVYKGTGIGLAHCKKIVDLHNGSIWHESAPQQGSRFYFTLPIIP